jgi:glycyl-tRNA synthetase beta chain
LDRSLAFLSKAAIAPYGEAIHYWDQTKFEAEPTAESISTPTVDVRTVFVNQDYIADKIAGFLRERMQFYLKDVRGFAYDVVNAVLATNADDVRDAIARAEALTEARESVDFSAISAAFKRINNILRQAEEKGFTVASANREILSPEATRLAGEAEALIPRVGSLRRQRSYREALALIATLRPAVDAFFERVMVLDPDPEIRGANLGLISAILGGFSGIADFSEIVVN